MEIRPENCTDEEWEYIQLLNDPDFAVRSNAAGGLHALDSECGVPPMLRRLTVEPHAGVRGSLVYYIGYLCQFEDSQHKEDALRVLEGILSTEKDNGIRDEITDAIRLIKEGT